jgi:Arc/MetJ family transcription regulator
MADWLRDVYDRSRVYTSGRAMRTNIVIDERLIGEAMRLTGAGTKRQAVEDALRLVVRLKRQEGLRAARGKLRWRGDLERMRRD